MFTLQWTPEAIGKYEQLRRSAEKIQANRAASGKRKSSKQEGLFKQVHKTLSLLRENPRHRGLNTHEYDSLENPLDSTQKVFEAYAQNRTPGAYRVFWCYGPGQGEITIIAITPHP